MAGQTSAAATQVEPPTINRLNDEIDVVAPPIAMACDGSDEAEKFDALAHLLAKTSGARRVVFPDRTCATSREWDLDVVDTTLVGQGKGATLLLLPSNRGTDFITFGKTLGYGYNNEVSHLVIQREDHIAIFTACISGSLLTVQSVPPPSGLPKIGDELGGAGIARGIRVVGLDAAPDRYKLSSSPGPIACEPMRSADGPTSGVGLRLYGQGPFASEDLSINAFSTNIRFEGGGKAHISNLESQQGQFWANLVPGSVGIDFVQHAGVNPSGFYMNAVAAGGVQPWQTVETSVNVAAMDGAYFSNGHLGNSAYDVKIQPTTDRTAIVTLTFVNEYFDGTGNVGGRALYVPPLTGTGRSISQVSFTGGVTNTHKVAAMDIEAQNTGPYSFTGMQALFEQGPFIVAPGKGSIVSAVANTLDAISLDPSARPGITIGGPGAPAASAVVSLNLFSSTATCLAVHSIDTLLVGNVYGVCARATPADTPRNSMTREGGYDGVLVPGAGRCRLAVAAGRIVAATGCK